MSSFPDIDRQAVKARRSRFRVVTAADPEPAAELEPTLWQAGKPNIWLPLFGLSAVGLWGLAGWWIWG